MNNNPKAPNQFVSRGGLKLEHAIKNFKLKIKNCEALDVGSSTGGFVDCLLQHGAKKVYSVDTAYGELAWKLRKDPRVVVMERTNILHLHELPKEQEDTPSLGGEGRGEGNETKTVDLITIDASWTKLELILPKVKKFLKPDGKIIALLKPHYEAEKSMLIKGVLPDEQIEKVKNKVFEKIENCKLKIVNCIPSPILGGGGNKEFLLLITPET